MASNIDATQPPASNPTTAAMRANMAAAKAEISLLQTRPHSRASRPFKGQYGRRLTVFSEAALQNSAGTAALVTTSDLPSRNDGTTKVLRLTQNAAQSFGQVVVASPDYATTSTVESFGIWVRNRGTASLSCLLSIFNTAGNKQITANFTVDPNNAWTFLTISPKSVIPNTFVYGTDAMHFVRISQKDAGGDVWPSGAVCDFGPVYVGTKGRARFVICNDDTTSSVYNPGPEVDGWPASGRSFREIVESYGFKGTLYCVPSLIDTAGYMTQSQLLEMQDSGWSIGSHSWSHPAYNNRGLTSLGPVGFANAADTYHASATNDDTAIYADVMQGVTALSALGIDNPDLLFALPQGAWDSYVRSAVMRTGIKHVRGISSYNNHNTLSIGVPSGGGSTGSIANLNLGGWVHQSDSVQTDGTLTLGNVQTYIDYLISIGATGSNFHHATTPANSVKLDGMCAYLKTKADAGLIEVVSGYQAAYDDGLI